MLKLANIIIKHKQIYYVIGCYYIIGFYTIQSSKNAILTEVSKSQKFFMPSGICV